MERRNFFLLFPERGPCYFSRLYSRIRGEAAGLGGPPRAPRNVRDSGPLGDTSSVVLDSTSSFDRRSYFMLSSATIKGAPQPAVGFMGPGWADASAYLVRPRRVRDLRPAVSLSRGRRSAPRGSRPRTASPAADSASPTPRPRCKWGWTCRSSLVTGGPSPTGARRRTSEPPNPVLNPRYSRQRFCSKSRNDSPRVPGISATRRERCVPGESPMGKMLLRGNLSPAHDTRKRVADTYWKSGL